MLYNEYKMNIGNDNNKLKLGFTYNKNIYDDNIQFYDYYPFNEIYKRLGGDITELIIKMSSFDYNNYKKCQGYECEFSINKKFNGNYCKKCYDNMILEGYTYCKYCKLFTTTCKCDDEFYKNETYYDDVCYYFENY